MRFSEHNISSASINAKSSPFLFFFLKILTHRLFSTRGRYIFKIMLSFALFNRTMWNSASYSSTEVLSAPQPSSIDKIRFRVSLINK